jgi:hypothetical protein
MGTAAAHEANRTATNAHGRVRTIPCMVFLPAL